MHYCIHAMSKQRILTTTLHNRAHYQDVQPSIMLVSQAHHRSGAEHLLIFDMRIAVPSWMSGKIGRVEVAEHTAYDRPSECIYIRLLVPAYGTCFLHVIRRMQVLHSIIYSRMAWNHTHPKHLCIVQQNTCCVHMLYDTYLIYVPILAQHITQHDKVSITCLLCNTCCAAWVKYQYTIAGGILMCICMYIGTIEPMGSCPWSTSVSSHATAIYRRELR